MKTFKQLVTMISKIETEHDQYEAKDEVTQSFQHQKITWNDHELLMNLIRKTEIR